jgi:hypothetical protein
VDVLLWPQRAAPARSDDRLEPRERDVLRVASLQDPDLPHALETASIVDILEARIILERNCVALACERRTAGEAATINQRASTLTSFRDNMAFHIAIASATHNFMLERPVGLARHARLALTDPGTEIARDVWELEVFGQNGRLTFTTITQPWLREAPKRFAADELPRHRAGRAGGVMRSLVGSLARLSASLRAARDDHGTLD